MSQPYSRSPSFCMSHRLSATVICKAEDEAVVKCIANAATRFEAPLYQFSCLPFELLTYLKDSNVKSFKFYVPLNSILFTSEYCRGVADDVQQYFRWSILLQTGDSPKDCLLWCSTIFMFVFSRFAGSSFNSSFPDRRTFFFVHPNPYLWAGAQGSANVQKFQFECLSFTDLFFGHELSTCRLFPPMFIVSNQSRAILCERYLHQMCGRPSCEEAIASHRLGCPITFLRSPPLRPVLQIWILIFLPPFIFHLIPIFRCFTMFGIMHGPGRTPQEKLHKRFDSVFQMLANEVIIAQWIFRSWAHSCEDVACKFWNKLKICS